MPTDHGTRQLIVERYLAGDTLAQVAEATGVSTTTAHRVVGAAGIMRPRGGGAEGAAKRRKPVPDEAVARYLAGESEKAVAASLGVSRQVIRRVLLERGIDPRNRSQGMFTRMARTEASERRRLTAAAHDAVRGTKQTDKHREKVATTLNGNLRSASHLEDALHAALAERGWHASRQTAVGRYNPDLTFPSVAVEVCGGNWLFTDQRRNARYVRKIKDLGKLGWHTILVQISGLAGKTISNALIDEIITFVQFASMNPSARREYRMIGGDGKTYLSGYADDDHIALVWPTTNRRNPITGRYDSITRKA